MNETRIRLMELGGKGYSCGQILAAMALEERGETNPGLVRAMAGLAYGCGDGRGTCGAFTAAACVLGLYAGKGEDREEPSERLPVMIQELSDWFVERAGDENGAVTCAAIVGEAGPQASRRTCGMLVAETFDKVMEILMTNGFDPAG